MSRNARKGKADMACSSNDSKGYKNKANHAEEVDIRNDQIEKTHEHIRTAQGLFDVSVIAGDFNTRFEIPIRGGRQIAEKGSKDLPESEIKRIN